MSYFITPNRKQLRFQELNLDMLIPEDHPVRRFWEVCEKLNLARLYQDYKITEDSEGRPANDPRVLLCLWVYGISRGIHSSRQLAEACKVRADFIWLCGGMTPEYRTLAYFRTNHSEALKEAFCELVLVLKRLGLISTEVFFQDGTKIRADVSARSFMTKDKLEREWQRVQLAYERFITYAEDDNSFEDVKRARRDKKLASQRAKLERALEAVTKLQERRKKLSKKEREAYPPEKAQVSLVDPDSRFMLMSDKTIKPAYNAQICVTDKSEIIIASGVSNEPADNNQLLPVVSEVKKNLELREIAGAYVTDGGYYKDEQIRLVKAAGVKNLIMPITNETDCDESREVKGRAESELGKELLKRRNGTIERIIGFIKERFRWRRFRLRGLVRVGCEWLIICLAYNICRYVKLMRVGG